MSENIIASLDIGTTKIAVVICRKTEQGSLEVIGVGNKPSHGVRNGVIINIDKTVSSIRQSIEEAELMAGVEVNELFVGVASGQVSGFNSKGMIAIASRGGDNEITQADVDRVIQTAQSVSIPTEREVLHVIPQEFIVDDQDGVLDPVGMSGLRLQVEVHMVTCQKSVLLNIRKAVERAGYGVADIILQPIASSEAILNEDEKEMGTVVVDIGGGTTDILLYIANSIWYSKVIPYGGFDVTKDLTIGLKTPNNSAESIKLQYGAALESLVDATDYIQTPLVGGRAPVKVMRRVIAEIIEARMRDIFEKIKESLKTSDHMERIAAGVVLTGGGSLCTGVDELAEQMLGMPVRVGKPVDVTGITEKVLSPIYSTAIGLARFGSTDIESYRPSEKGKGAVFGKIGQFFRDFF